MAQFGKGSTGFEIAHSETELSDYCVGENSFTPYLAKYTIQTSNLEKTQYVISLCIIIIEIDIWVGKEVISSLYCDFYRKNTLYSCI